MQELRNDLTRYDRRARTMRGSGQTLTLSEAAGARAIANEEEIRLIITINCKTKNGECGNITEIAVWIDIGRERCESRSSDLLKL